MTASRGLTELKLLKEDSLPVKFAETPVENWQFPMPLGSHPNDRWKQIWRLEEKSEKVKKDTDQSKISFKTGCESPRISANHFELTHFGYIQENYAIQYYDVRVANDFEHY